jgi:hypothetical protein
MGDECRNRELATMWEVTEGLWLTVVEILN